VTLASNGYRRCPSPRRGELLVKGEEVLQPVPVAGKRFEAITAIHRAVELLMGELADARASFII
jgi:hypothetical protein